MLRAAAVVVGAVVAGALVGLAAGMVLIYLYERVGRK